MKRVQTSPTSDFITTKALTVSYDLQFVVYINLLRNKRVIGVYVCGGMAIFIIASQGSFHIYP